MTEKEYFECLAPEIGNIDVKCIERYGYYKNTTYLDDLIDLTHRRIKFYRDGVCNALYFISALVDQYCPKMKPCKSKEEKRINKAKYEAEFKEYQKLIEKVFFELKSFLNVNFGVDYIDKDNVESALVETEEIIMKIFNKPYERPKLEVIEDISPCESKEIGNPNHEFDIIHDRDWCNPGDVYDYQPFDDDDYMKALERVRDEGLNLYITSPNFEYWLLMHHDEFKKFNVKTLDYYLSSFYHTGEKKSTDYRRDTWRKGKEMVKIKLNHCENRKTHSNMKGVKGDRFEKNYRTHYLKAAEYAVVEDLRCLVDRSGSNVGFLIKKMINP